MTPALFKCRVCGRTPSKNGEPSRGWADSTLCNPCKDAVEDLQAWLADARRPNIQKLVREVRRFNQHQAGAA